MKEVNSSTIKHVWYNPGTRKMGVQFRSKGEPIYDYSDVDPADHARMMSAESIGSHLHHHIKPKYTGIRREEK